MPFFILNSFFHMYQTLCQRLSPVRAENGNNAFDSTSATFRAFAQFLLI